MIDATPLPTALATIVRRRGAVPASAVIDPAGLCVFDGRYFVRARGSLPLHSDDVGAWVWVELTSDDFGRLLTVERDTERWRGFRAPGTLASDWCGYRDLLGVPVVVRALGDDLRIVEVWVDRDAHPGFHRALAADEQ